ncbi:MAG: hypothetical protein LQ344_004446 [Seirophora lacunosa]|nr:MAG: hypothetical protein LQ344_004446 [Seirophora lacunosa]
MFSSSALYLLPTLFIPCLFAANCYRPDGELVTDPSYVPCDRAAADTGSMCCALNRSSYPDQCLSNGLCGGGGNLFRDSCTDPTWKSPMCLQLCTTGFGPSGTAVGLAEDTILNYSSSDLQITDCNDGSYCCGSANTTCCRRRQGVRIASILEAPSSTSGSETTPASSKSSIPTFSPVAATDIGAETTAPPSAAPTPSPGNNDLPGIEQKATIGIAVGCSVIGVAIAAAILWFFFVRKRHRSAGFADESVVDNIHELNAQGPIYEKDAPVARHELWGIEPHAELNGHARAELKG